MVRYSMKLMSLSLIFILINTLLYEPINCNPTLIGPPIDNNLLPNGSFEINNIPTLNGWRFGNKQLAKLVNEAPAGGGNWSLELTSDWAPTTGYVYTPVLNVKSGDIVRLSAYVRAYGKFGGRGIIGLSVSPNFSPNYSKSAYSSDSIWNRISVIDTLILTPSDTLWVFLSAPITEIVPFQQLFDLVKLEKISN